MLEFSTAENLCNVDEDTSPLGVTQHTSSLGRSAWWLAQEAREHVPESGGMRREQEHNGLWQLTEKDLLGFFGSRHTSLYRLEFQKISISHCVHFKFLSNVPLPHFLLPLLLKKFLSSSPFAPTHFFPALFPHNAYCLSAFTPQWASLQDTAACSAEVTASGCLYHRDLYTVFYYVHGHNPGWSREQKSIPC